MYWGAVEKDRSLISQSHEGYNPRRILISLPSSEHISEHTHTPGRGPEVDVLEEQGEQGRTQRAAGRREGRQVRVRDHCMSGAVLLAPSVIVLFGYAAGDVV